eukprot:22707-Chlamydomonas_euryale.AAC.10
MEWGGCGAQRRTRGSKRARAVWWGRSACLLWPGPLCVWGEAKIREGWTAGVKLVASEEELGRPIGRLQPLAAASPSLGGSPVSPRRPDTRCAVRHVVGAARGSAAAAAVCERSGPEGRGRAASAKWRSRNEARELAAAASTPPARAR